MNRQKGSFSLAAAAAGLFLLICVCCTGSHSGYDVIFIGIDALDWQVMNPLMESGRLPNFARLKNAGTTARINTNETGGSAVYWTTIATGQHASKHGITGFVYRDPETKDFTPFTSNMRKTKAFWNILSEAGISVGIIGWYISWPAEEVKGYMISSYMGLKEEDQMTWKGSAYAGVSGMVYPPDLQTEVDRFIETAEKAYLPVLGNIIKPRALLKEDRETLTVKGAFLTDKIYHESALQLLEKTKTRVFAVYYSCLDVVGHQFTHPDASVQAVLDEKYGTVQENYYRYLDRILEYYLSRMKRESILMVVSDHGLRASAHTDDGVFMAVGPPIKDNHRALEGINLTDITPTLLYLLDQPVSLEMDGRVFTGAVKNQHILDHPVRYIRSYGRREQVEQIPRKSQFDERIIERLKALGYIK